MNNVKQWREKNNLTQKELAEKSGVSLRTIQRIEAGSPLKGFTLNAIAMTLETSPENLFLKETGNTERAKSINLSALLGLIIPFGGIIFPLILISKTKDILNKQLGKKIVEIQIILAVLQSVFFNCRSVLPTRIPDQETDFYLRINLVFDNKIINCGYKRHKFK